MKYTQELLDTILREGGAKAVQLYPNYNQRLRVTFICECGLETSKRFEMLQVHRLPYCEGCSLKKKAERGKKTCMEKYGVGNVG